MENKLTSVPNEACTRSDEQTTAGINENHAAAASEMEIDFSDLENRPPNPSVGFFNVKPANEWIEEACRRPTPKMLFGQLWYEHEICILFSDSNLGKSILGVQIAEAISSGHNTMGLKMEAKPQKVLYFDFELSDKQFQGRYTNEKGECYRFSPNLKRVEINTDILDDPDDTDFEEYIKLSLEQVVEKDGAKVLILDNITFLSRETEKAKDALPLMRWLKSFGNKYGLSILVLAHTPKRNLSNPITKNDLQGSKMLYNFCDGCFAIGESSKGSSYRYIKELKQRNVSFQYDAGNVIVCEIVKPDTFLMFRFVEFSRESEHLRQYDDYKRDNLKEQVIDLSDRGMSQREISKELGISLGVVNKYLNN